MDLDLESFRFRDSDLCGDFDVFLDLAECPDLDLSFELVEDCVVSRDFEVFLELDDVFFELVDDWVVSCDFEVEDDCVVSCEVFDTSCDDDCSCSAVSSHCGFVVEVEAEVDIVPSALSCPNVSSGSFIVSSSTDLSVFALSSAVGNDTSFSDDSSAALLAPVIIRNNFRQSVLETCLCCADKQMFRQFYVR